MSVHNVTPLTSLAQLNGILAQSEEKLTVIDFYATWCGPCRAIAPVFQHLSSENQNVNFLKCDVDACDEVSEEYGIRAMPTFVFLKGNTKVGEVSGATGANPPALASALAKYSGQ